MFTIKHITQGVGIRDEPPSTWVKIMTCNFERFALLQIFRHKLSDRAGIGLHVDKHPHMGAVTETCHRLLRRIGNNHVVLEKSISYDYTTAHSHVVIRICPMDGIGEDVCST